MAFQEFQESKKADKLIFSWPAIMLVGFLCAAALVGISKVLLTEFALQKEINTLELKIKEAETSKKNFEEKLEAIRMEQGLDREARGKFNLKKPGEEVVLFVGDGLAKNVPEKTGLASVLAFLKKWLPSF
ncbi:hypothetical protein A2926_00010 [Candidatus Giovannonibacteria bacterium RIFCSPLOWO2_01_FULL_44_40]|uniref:Cell division protein FtsL n=1 Tax=Candidatus Giovannonibacteria bacterium RIFCSPHIGHO2_01_FULL_45_23 TaxID=1798325 RepID=A0A1F5VFS4_9BACT|nr:MAG: hypothetical protein A2834_00965 [Candidatus Giovannonibacteria bacterium RIFCSPHIGHO2_01_FULL_45_23]OGF75297.1 MAG: hypothetical protein A3C77_01170 [Candidatus Giovannonibacteria bacterium RIFCSPHIGHO2_02_FULL_45_13]OGF80366.1 MAG: hypothetical protein A2926_00010 [Candidatus Giovannonibacteria bacterium RIFCSPLOWO2_01_FULL_44_40]